MIKKLQKEIYKQKFEYYRSSIERYDVDAALERLAPPGGRITERKIYATVLTVDSSQRRMEAMTSTIASSAIGSLFGMVGAAIGTAASTSFSYIASGYSSTPPDGSYGAVVLEATIERTKTVIGGYDAMGVPFPTTIKTEETLLAYYYFDAGEHNDGFAEFYIPTNDPRFW